MVGLALACGGASALNHVLDADIDRLMGKRTEKRPVAAGRVPPARALEFGLALSALSFVLLASTVNVLTAALALVGNLFYVLVYTRWLKRSTPQNIVIGGAAGAVPPLVGWAAATGNLALPALLLFLIVFFWTPPHFWALALLIKDNYAARRADAAGRPRRARDDAADRALHDRPGRGHARRRDLARAALHRRRAVLGGAFLSLAWQLRREHDRRARGAPLPLLARSTWRCSSSRWPSTRCCCERADARARAEEPAPRLGALRLFLLLFAGTVGVALLYLALD